MASERCSSQAREAELQLLERQVHQLTAKMADMEAQGRSKLRSAIGALETKLREAEEQLEAENRYRCMLGDDVMIIMMMFMFIYLIWTITFLIAQLYNL